MIDFETHAIVILLLVLLICTAITILRMRDLWAAVMLMGIFSFLGAGWMLILDAPDVAFTEAAVGAGIATFLMLSTLSLTSREAKPATYSPVRPIAVVVLTGAALVYGTFDMPHYGDPQAPIHLHPNPSYIEKTANEIGVDNVVTSILASYRSYDTLGETVVIFTAGIGVLLLLRKRRKGVENLLPERPEGCSAQKDPGTLATGEEGAE